MNMPVQRPWVIGHRGACGHWPENTLASIGGAHALGADWVEVDVVLSRDGEPVLSHDVRLEATTDIAARFPGRARADGGFYAIDFDWAELATLRVGARIDVATGQPAHPGREIRGAGDEGPCRLGEAAELLERLARETGREAGLVVEVKVPAWHRGEGRDIGEVTLAALAGVNLPLVIETFDPAELCHWRVGWPEAPRWCWWQLLGENDWGEADCDYDALRSPAGLRRIAEYADGVAVNLPRATPDFLAAARAVGLTVSAYTARADAPDGGLPRVLTDGGLDGVFTDHPDVVARWRANEVNAKGLRRVKL